MQVRIYQPTKNAMQSGRARVASWVLEYESDTARVPEGLMGWTSSGDTRNQVRLRFRTMEDACAFAAEKGWTCDVVLPHERVLRPRNYGDNFKTFPQDNA